MSKNEQDNDIERSNSMNDLKCGKTMEKKTSRNLRTSVNLCLNSRICHRPKRKNHTKSFDLCEYVPKFPELLPEIPSLVLSASTDNDDDGMESDYNSDGISLEDLMRNRRKKGSLLYNNNNSTLESNSKKIKTSDADQEMSSSLDLNPNQINLLSSVFTKTIENTQGPQIVTTEHAVPTSFNPKMVLRPIRKNSIRQKITKEKPSISLLRLPLTASPLTPLHQLNTKSHTCIKNNNVQEANVLSHMKENNKYVNSSSSDRTCFNTKIKDNKEKLNFVPSHFPFFTFTPPSAIKNEDATKMTHTPIEKKFELSCFIKNSEQYCILQTPRMNVSSDLFHRSPNATKHNQQAKTYRKKKSLKDKKAFNNNQISGPKSSSLNDDEGISRICYFSTPV